LELDPLSSYAHAVDGLTCALAGRHEESLQSSRRAVELDPESYLACMIRQGVLHVNGRLEESVAAAESALALSGRLSWSMATLAVTLADFAKPDEAEAIYAELLARSRRGYISPVHLAYGAAATSQEDELIRHTREAFVICDPFCAFFLSKYFPYSARLHAYRSFRQLLEEVGYE
jgi:tetratricopeptide (TPR) repeat protein